ncbi:MAG: diacylglycerol/polyprenol kinase family protein [Candidatus Heimdallarchaeota archaeon]
MEQETKRKIIHISMGFLSLLLGIFPRWMSVLCVLVALFFVGIIARPSVWKMGFDVMASRVEDRDSGTLHGPILYVLMVLLSVIFLDLRVAAAVFVIMAFGDGLANVVGTRYGVHRFEQLNGKSFEGFITFLGSAFVCSVFIVSWVSMNPAVNPWIPLFEIRSVEQLSLDQIGITCFQTSLVCAIIELTTGNFVNDNISVPIIAGALLTILLK